MMLTVQQQRAIEDGQVVEITVGGTPCILLRREAYSKLKRLLAMDDYDPKEGMALMNRVMADDDADDPLLESYQRYGAPS